MVWKIYSGRMRIVLVKAEREILNLKGEMRFLVSDRVKRKIYGEFRRFAHYYEELT